MGVLSNGEWDGYFDNRIIHVMKGDEEIEVFTTNVKSEEDWQFSVVWRDCRLYVEKLKKDGLSVPHHYVLQLGED